MNSPRTGLKKPLNPVHIQFGQMVRQRRLELGISQYTLTLEAGLNSMGTVSYCELGGGVTLATAIALASYLEIDLGELM